MTHDQDVIETIKESLSLIPHPEGGHFKECYRANETIAPLSHMSTGHRPVGTSIYYLLEHNEYSAWHRLDADEQWCHHQGGVLLVHTLDEKNHAFTTHRIGPISPEAQDVKPQLHIPHGVWFAAELEDKNSYALSGCQVFPGFDFQGFELADKAFIAHFDDHPLYSKIQQLLPKHLI